MNKNKKADFQSIYISTDDFLVYMTHENVLIHTSRQNFNQNQTWQQTQE